MRRCRNKHPWELSLMMLLLIAAASCCTVEPTLRYTGMFSCASLQFLPSARVLCLIKLLRMSFTRSQDSPLLAAAAGLSLAACELLAKQAAGCSPLTFDNPAIAFRRS